MIRFSKPGSQTRSTRKKEEEGESRTISIVVPEWAYKWYQKQARADGIKVQKAIAFVVKEIARWGGAKPPMD